MCSDSVVVKINKWEDDDDENYHNYNDVDNDMK